MASEDLMRQLQANAFKAKTRREEASNNLTQMATQAAMESAQSAPSQGREGAGSNSSGRQATSGESGAVDYNGSDKVDPYAPMKTLNFKGQQYTVNSSVAGRFQGFLRALSKQGYVPKSIGGHSDRNIAGTSTKSLHSYGLAIDIDPSGNGVQYGDKFNTTLPNNVGRLASRFGLTWGGDWNGSKKDPMHFSVPFFGTK